METYERLICDLGHCLLTKGLNNDFTESGRDLGMGVMCTGGRTQRACRETQRIAFRIMLPDRYSKTLSEKVNFSSLTVLRLFWLMLRCNKNLKTSSVGTASLIVFCIDPFRNKSSCSALFYTGRSDT